MDASFTFELLGHRLKSISYNESLYDEWLRKEFVDVADGGEITVKFGISVSVGDPSIAEGEVDGKRVIEMELTFIISIGDGGDGEGNEITVLTMSFVAGFLGEQSTDAQAVLKEFEGSKVLMQRNIYWAVRPAAVQIMNQTLLNKVPLPWDAIHDRIISDIKERRKAPSNATRKRVGKSKV